MKRRCIVEKWSISDIVKTYTDKISEKIIVLSEEQFINKEVKYSPITNAAYVEGNFEIDTFEFGNDEMPPSLKIEYIMYEINSASAYNNIIKKEDKGFVYSESDYKQCYIRIVSGYIGDYLIPDFYENVAHEVTHIYQYAQGMRKKVNLYDEVIKLYNSAEKSKHYVGYALYFTFKHEQDAMTHQFYEYLNNINFNANDFEMVLNNFNEYKQFLNSINNVKDIDKNDLKNILNSIGFSVADYNKRIHYSFKRLVQKLNNAFNRNLYDICERTKGLLISYNMSKELMYEDTIKKYDFKPLIKIESIYEF